MYRAASILTALFFVSSLSAGKTSFASEEAPSAKRKTRISRPSEPTQERSVLRQLAVALVPGGEALNSFRGPTIENEEGKEPVQASDAGMDYSVHYIANYVSCYGSAIGSEEEADRRFIRLINDLQGVLPTDRWED